MPWKKWIARKHEPEAPLDVAPPSLIASRPICRRRYHGWIKVNRQSFHS